MKAKKVSLFIIVCMMNVWVTAETQPDAAEMLQRFSTARKNLHSFMIESREESSYTYPGFKGIGKGYNKSQLRFDGQRCKNTMYLWGDINIKVRNVKEQDAGYHSELWNGQTGYIYDCGMNPFVNDNVSGLIVVSGDQAKACSESYKRTTAGLMMGYHFGDNESMIELFWKPFVNLGLRPKKYKIHGVDCYVLDADVPGKGKYTVWIDPVHDFHIARTQVQRKKGDFIGDMELVEKNQIRKEFYEVLEFQKIEGIWFPKTCMTKCINRADNYYAYTERKQSILSVILDPDHEKLKSFGFNDIPEGTPTQLRWRPPDKGYIWQDGKVVDSEGNVVFEPSGHLPIAGEELKKHPEAGSFPLR